MRFNIVLCNKLCLRGGLPLPILGKPFLLLALSQGIPNAEKPYIREELHRLWNSSFTGEHLEELDPNKRLTILRTLKGLVEFSLKKDILLTPTKFLASLCIIPYPFVYTKPVPLIPIGTASTLKTLPI